MKCDLLPVKPFFTSFKVFPERERLWEITLNVSLSEAQLSQR